jgi:hypothetical protein
MIDYRRYAHFTLLRDASLFAFAGVILMIAFSFEPALALDIGATVALAFAITLLIRSRLLTPDRVRRSEVWRALRPDERPAGEPGIRVASATMQELLLRFAKTASATAIFLYGAGLTARATIGFNGL